MKKSNSILFSLSQLRDTPAGQHPANAHLFQEKHKKEKKLTSEILRAGIPKGLQFIKDELDKAGIEYKTEYRFHPARKFRFDIAIVDKFIGIEYEGLQSKKSRHTTITGYSKDADKYNLAQSLGWKVFRNPVIFVKEI